MIKIAVCDDNPYELEEVAEKIKKKQKKDLNNDGASLYNGTRKAAERSA